MVKGYIKNRPKYDFVCFWFQEANKEIRDWTANITCPKERAKFKKQNKEWRDIYSFYKNNHKHLNNKWKLEKHLWEKEANRSREIQKLKKEIPSLKFLLENKLG
tara:strand:+ start:661 stop:972 length:312 start_codon:yes stop_codon:yes gene_type:complete